MDLRELYYLNALAEEQSISKAAERLYIAQASLSQFLRQFEAQLGSPLFVRTNKGIRPTPSGKVFLSHAKHILKEYQQAQQEFWDNENTVGGTVFFGVSSFRGSYVRPAWTRPGGSASRWRKSPAMSASSAARIPCWVT